MSGRWTVGECANCGSALNPQEEASLYCSQRCKGTAKDMRYFRRCYRDGRWRDPDVRAALAKRMAFHVAGGYDAKARHLSPDVRREVLSANNGLCCECNMQPATEVDHISDASSDRSNLQGLCTACHDAKTNARMRPMPPEAKAKRDAFMALVCADKPAMAAHDELAWDKNWRAKMADTRKWRTQSITGIEKGPLADGSRVPSRV